MNKQIKVCYAARGMKQTSECPGSSIIKETLGEPQQDNEVGKNKREEALEQMNMLVNAIKCLKYNQLPGCKNNSLVTEGLLIVSLSQRCYF